ncbi:unnamed protein product [Umbelopsis sp. WA50703]
MIPPGLKRIAVTLRLRRPRNRIISPSTLHQTSTNASVTPSSQLQSSQRSNDGADTPSNSLIRHLIDLYYTYASFMFPWESKSTILSDMEEDAASTCLIYCMCAIGARYSTHPEVCISGKERYCYGEPFADRAKRLLIPLLALPSLEVVQSLVLLTYQEFATDRDSGLWMYAGMAIRMAQDIGLEKEPLPIQHVNSDQSPEPLAHDMQQPTLPTYKNEREREIRRRVFWTVYFLDRLTSIGLGRRFVMWENGIETALPSYNADLDDNLWLNPKNSTDGEDHLPLPYTYVAQMMRIHGKISTILNFCEEPDKRLIQLKDALERLQDFYQQIPTAFEFTVENFQIYSSRSLAGGFLLVHFWYHALVILVNCPTFLATNLHSKLPNIENWEQAYSSAKAISDFLSYVDLLNSSAYLANPFINQCIYVAACALVQKIQNRLSNEEPLQVYNTLPFNERLDVSSDQASYEICRKALLRMQSYWLGMNWTNVSLEQYSRGILDIDLCMNDNNEDYKEGNIPLLDNGLLRKLRDRERSESRMSGEGKRRASESPDSESAQEQRDKKRQPPIDAFSIADHTESLKVLPFHSGSPTGQSMDVFNDPCVVEEVVLSDLAFTNPLTAEDESLLDLISNSNMPNDLLQQISM